MRPTVLATCIFSIVCLPAFAGINAPVTGVVLYPGGATVTRTAQIVPGGGSIVVALPANFNAESLRVQASGGASVAGITTQKPTGDGAVNPAVADISARIQALRDQQAVTEAEIASAAMVRQYLERFVQAGSSSNTSAAGADPKVLAGLVDTLGRGSSEAMVKVQRLTAQNRETARKIDELQYDLARLSRNVQPPRNVTVRVAGAKGGSVALSYQLNNAGWKPGYRAGLDSVASTVDLERLATISQNTGEDWSNVKLTLSTSQPRTSPVGREPLPWLLAWHVSREVANDVRQESVTITPSRLQRAAASAPAPAALGDNLMAEIQTTFATQFEVPGLVSLPSDGSEVLVALSSHILAVKQHVRVSPRLEPAGIVIAEASRPEGVWPAGPIQLFRDGHYVGSTYWNQQNGERAQFAFGRDDLVKVAVNAVDGKAGTKGLFGTRSSRDTADVFTLINHHKSPVNVVVLESSPVSTVDEVKVQARFSPAVADEAWEQRRGVVAWKRTLAAGETAKFNVEYRIEFPKDGVLTGMQ